MIPTTIFKQRTKKPILSNVVGGDVNTSHDGSKLNSSFSLITFPHKKAVTILTAQFK